MEPYVVSRWLPYGRRAGTELPKMFTILIVEDSPAYRQSLREMLCSRFPVVQVEEAGDGTEALTVIENGLPALVFMDIRLPGENGLELTRRIKQAHQDLPVVILTNYDLSEYKEAAFEFGADHFLPKESSTFQEIAAIVEALLRVHPVPADE